MRWVVIFKDSEQMLGVRADRALRNKHVAYAESNPQLLIGGGLKVGPDAPFCGALWVVEAETREEVEELIQRDPFYVPEFRSFEIYTWGKILEDREVVL